MTRPNITADRFRFLEGAEHPSIDQAKLSLEGDTRWLDNNASFRSYNTRAFGADGENSLRKIIDAQIGQSPSNVGLDMGGGSNGVALQNLLIDGTLGQALVTNYEDRRSESARSKPALDHEDGDILLPETWEKIINWQQRVAPEGINLVMHRPSGALQHLQPNIYRQSAHILLDMIAPGGVMFSQIPEVFNLQNQTWPGRKLGPIYKEAICRGIRRRSDIESVTEYVAPDDYGVKRPNHVVIIKKS